MSTVVDVRTDPVTGIETAAAAIAAGKCIVLPTDTVYGIGADALNAAAVRSLLQAKRRGRDMPPPVLISEPAMLRSLADVVTEDALALAEKFWPGALTLVVRSHPSLRMDLGDRGHTIAVRIPAHDFTRDLLRVTGPLAVSSANLSGQPAATSITGARKQLGARVAVYLNAGRSSGPVPSTIVDVHSAETRILRPGRVTQAELAAVVAGLAEG